MQPEESMEQWNNAIARRISDEWVGRLDFPSDAEKIFEVVLSGLIARPDLTEALIGSGVIEEDYFKELS